jgi:hypothetical protein
LSEAIVIQGSLRGGSKAEAASFCFCCYEQRTNITGTNSGLRVQTYQARPAEQKPEVIVAHFGCQCYPFDRLLKGPFTLV